MAEFTLDTSGAVVCNGLRKPGFPADSVAGSVFYWTDLSPFAQGYIEAAWQEIVERIDDQELAAYIAAGGEDSFKGPALGFSNLAPETLAAILKDCEEFQQSQAWRGYVGGALSDPGIIDPERGGRMFWNERQGLPGGFVGAFAFPQEYAQRLHERAEIFPPLTPYLDDTGKVRLRPA